MHRPTFVLTAALFLGAAVAATAAGLPAGWKAREETLDYDMIRDVETTHAGTASASLRSMGIPLGGGRCCRRSSPRSTGVDGSG
jgi:hypothetical protein